MEFQKGLKSRGFDVTVLTALPNYPTGRIFDEYRGKVEDWDENEKILRTHIFPFKRKSAALRLITYLSFLNSSQTIEKKRFPEGSFDIVIASSPPLFVGQAGSNIAKRHGAKFIFDVRDVWPDVAVNMGLLPRRGTVARWLGAINRRILKNADLVLVTNCSDMETIASKGYPREKIIKIPNGANLEIFKPLPVNESAQLKKQKSLDGKFVICYSGSLNRGMNDVNAFVPLMSKLKDDKDISLLLIGDGENLGEIRDSTARQNLTNIIFLNTQTIEELGITLNTVDLGLIPRKALSTGKSGGLPVKMFECWALGKPVLMAAGRNTEERTLLEDVRGGIAVDPGDIDAMASAISQLKNNPKLTSELGQNGRRAVVEKYSREPALERLVDALKKLV